VKEPDLLRTTPVDFKIHSGTDIEIQESEEAQDIILGHPKCAVQRLAWLVCFESDYKECYMGATGAMVSDPTQIFLLEM